MKEFAKTKATLHQFDSYNQMQAMNNAPMNAPRPLQSTQMGQPDQSTTNEPLGGNMGINQPNTPSTPQGQPTVGKYDNL
jgi:hypothetical protein